MARVIFQLGTNNWQRQGEFAPGSGILHEAHHQAYEAMADTKCFSMYPSEKQSQPDPPANYRVIKLDHNIPICESISPVSNLRWHSFTSERFVTYLKRVEAEVYDFMEEIEKREGCTFTVAVAHHSFTNPLVMRNVLAKRVQAGKPRIPLFCFVHGTALKMYQAEMAGHAEFPPRFHPYMVESKLFDGAGDIAGCFAISEDQKVKFQETFPSYPAGKVIVSPNGVNQLVFCKQSKTLAQCLEEHVSKTLWPAGGKADPAAIESAVVFVGKFADWKRLDAVLVAAKEYETKLPKTATLIVGSGPEEDVKKYHDLASSLELQRTYFVGPHPQPVLAELFSVATVGVFPSFEEPFGMVFVECMACGTPVIGADSGGPKDFVTEAVGTLLPEPEQKFDNAAVGASLAKAVNDAITQDWKSSKGGACVELAEEKFSVKTQCVQLLKDVDKLAVDLAEGKGYFDFPMPKETTA